MSMFTSCFVRFCSRASVRSAQTSHSDVATTARLGNKHCRKRAPINLKALPVTFSASSVISRSIFALLAALIALWSLPCAWNVGVSTQSRGP